MSNTATDVILMEVIKTAKDWSGETYPEIEDGQSVTEYYDILLEDGLEDYLQDAMNDFRGSGEVTSLEAPYSRHYESEQVARVIDGKAVCWTHWYGGGKHSNPEEIGWVGDAFFVNVTQETKVVNVFTKVEEPSQ